MPTIKTQQLVSNMDIGPRRIAFVGLDKAGKTTTLNRISRGVLTRTKPTHGYGADVFTFLGIRFNVYDLAGQEIYHLFWDRFLPHQEAIVFFIDAADSYRLDKVRQALNKTLSLMKPKTIVMILANKQDLPEALDLPDLINALDLDLASKAKQLQIFEVSAKTGAGLHEAFQWLASMLEINIGVQKCTLYGFFVYQKNVGLPLVT
ncbi:MAG: ADP-ribosylation factor-like protein, partial [Candidatus Hodarchaeota archaeon]